MTRFVEWLQSAGLDEERPIAGLSQAEIDEVAVSQGQTKLPAAYQEFLADCGKGAGLFQRDAAFFFPEVKGLKHQLVEMLEDEGIEIVLPAEAFVFGAYQGFQFHYFLCDNTADPVVYQIDDGSQAPSVVAESFSNYIRQGIEQYRGAFYRKS